MTNDPVSLVLTGAPPSSGYRLNEGDVIIGSDVWLGRGATVLSGVTIGDGTVIGAGSVVARDVPPYANVACNPAPRMRYRFEADQIEAFLRIGSWNWPLDRIRQELPLFQSAGAEAFVRAHDPQER